jgi:hypothetical protein
MRHIHYYIAAICALFLMGAPARAADCALDLKETDDYRALTAKLKCLENRIKTLEGGAASTTNATSTPSAAPASGAPTSALSQEVGGVRFEIDTCQQNNTEIICKLFITAIDADVNFTLLQSSRVVDDNGVSYFLGRCHGAGDPGWNFIPSAQSFISDVRTELKLQFNGRPEQKPKKLPRFSFEIQMNDKTHSIVSKNIPIQ